MNLPALVLASSQLVCADRASMTAQLTAMEMVPIGYALVINERIYEIWNGEGRGWAILQTVREGDDARSCLMDAGQVIVWFDHRADKNDPEL